ncbi:AraC family transcriptional regulator [Paenibacillus sp. GCM10023252]|uniref:AraC family transcriptional regulator n=1 Tax=Paenibacillus sp. GCM10023252 TaxID=3252649 RepID=UPI0036229CBE
MLTKLKRMLRFNRRSVLTTWLLSYMAVLLLPIIMSIIVYHQSSRALNHEIHAANSSLLKQVREIMDSQFQAMERLNFELSWNVKIKELLDSYKYQKFPNEFQYDLYKITRDLITYRNSYSMVDLFYVYMASSNIVMQADTYRDSRFAYELLHRDSSLTYEEWQAIMKGSHKGSFIPMVRLGPDNKPVKSIAYISSYPNAFGDKPIGTNVIMMDQSRILGAIRNVEHFNQGHVMILNHNQEVLVSSSTKPLPAAFPYRELNNTNGSVQWTYAGETFEVSSIYSSKSKLHYVSIIPSRLVWEKAERIRSFTYASIAISLLGGIMLTAAFLWMNYHPVRQLVQSFARQHRDGEDRRGTNEFHYLQDSINQTLMEMDRIQLTQQQQRHILRSNFMTRLLKGKLDNQLPVEESLEAFQMTFHSDSFAVILLYMESNSAFMERIPNTGMDESGKLHFLHFIISNVVEEMAGQGGHRGYVTEVDNTLACLVNLSPEVPSECHSEQLTAMARQSQAFLAKEYHIHLTLSLSRVHRAFPGISAAYSEAIDAMEYKLIKGSKEILSYEAIYLKEGQAENNSGYYYPLQVEQQLMNYMKVGDFTLARETLCTIIERNFSKPGVSIPIARCLMLNLASTMIKTINELGDAQDSFLMQNPKRIERLIACETVQEMQEQMTALLHKVCEYTACKRQSHMEQNRQRGLDELTASVSRYIEDNYADPNLNVTTIGLHYNLKPTYLSKLFKDHTGEALLDCINRRRMDAAKLLLQAERSKSIGDISQEVGYGDVNSFIRAFKRYEGITPGKYKETLLE